MGLEHAVNAPIPVSLGGRDFLVKRLDTTDIGELGYWGRAFKLKIIFKTMAEVLTAQERETMLRGISESASDDWDAIKGAFDSLKEIYGLGYCLYLAARKVDLSVTFEEIRRLITLQEDVASIRVLAMGVFLGGPMENVSPPAAEAVTDHPGK